MAGLQRSAVSFRRQGSSGLVWDDRFLSGELNKLNNNNNSNEEKENKQQQQQQQQDTHQQEQKGLNNKGTTATVQRSRSSNGGYRAAGRVVSPAIEPPSPKLSACGFCGAFGKTNSKGQRSKGLNNNNKHHRSR